MKVCGNLEESWVEECFRELRHFQEIVTGLFPHREAFGCGATTANLHLRDRRLALSAGACGEDKDRDRADTAQSWKLTRNVEIPPISDDFRNI